LIKRHNALSSWAIFGTLFALEVASHYSLLRLPYFWDEAGYYIPATRDLFQTGSLIPFSAPSNAHPPLVMAYLALCWKIAGASALVTRTAMLAIAAFGLLGLFRLSAYAANRRVACATVACTAVYPVFFAQSSMAHVDLAAAALTFWALDAFLQNRALAAALWFSLAVLAKETTILVPGALLAWGLVCPVLTPGRKIPLCDDSRAERGLGALVAPIAVLLIWYAYHFAKTGYVFGNPEFFRYNVQATVSPLRIVLALVMRLWQIAGYLHLFVLTLITAWLMTRAPLRDGENSRPRIAIPIQCMFGAVILAYVMAMAVIGGAVLARYMLPVVPLVILICVSTLWRRSRHWLALTAFVLASFIAGLFMNPPYGFALEDNLAYRDYIEMHLEAARKLEQRPPQLAVLTAWPASDELTRPYLGYVTHPIPVIRVEDFTREQLDVATQIAPQFDSAFLFSTKYEAGKQWIARWPWWQMVKRRYFGYHEDESPQAAAEELGGRLTFEEHRRGQWVAIVTMERSEEARSGSGGHEMAGVGFDDQPDGASRLQAQIVASRESHLHFKFDAAIYPGLHDHVALLQPHDSPRENVARAQTLGKLGRQ